MSSPGQKFGLSANTLLEGHRDREARTPSRGVVGRCRPGTLGCRLPRAAATGGRPDAVALVLRGPLSGTQARETLARGPRQAPTATPALGPAPASQGRPGPASGKGPAQAPVPGPSLQATPGGTQPGRAQGKCWPSTCQGVLPVPVARAIGDYSGPTPGPHPGGPTVGPVYGPPQSRHRSSGTNCLVTSFPIKPFEGGSEVLCGPGTPTPRLSAFSVQAWDVMSRPSFKYPG